MPDAAPARSRFGRFRIYVDLLVLLCGGAAAAYYYQGKPAEEPEPTQAAAPDPGHLEMPPAARLVSRPESSLTAPIESSDAEDKGSAEKPKGPTFRPKAFSRKVGQGFKRPLERPVIEPPAETRRPRDTPAVFERAPISADSPALARPPENAAPEGDSRFGGHSPRSVIAAVAGVFVAAYFILARLLFRNLRTGDDNDHPLTLN